MSWISDTHLRGLAWMALSLVLSCVLTALAIRYARRNNVVDQPGQRRSHSTPTPRGGGIGIVVCGVLGLIALPLLELHIDLQLRFIASIVLIAAIGWIDDHRPLPAWLRFVVQTLAVGVWLAPLLRVALLPSSDASALGTSQFETAGVALLLVVLTLWSVNLHNFMDGIDGLLATQAIFVLSALTVLGLRESTSPHPLQLAMWIAAILGFLPFNFPRARVFMGDVGSGVIGFIVAVAIVWQTSMPEIAFASGFIAVSAFVTDATCTLLSRMLSGRRWYHAHREHLYQWLTRTGMSHARVVMLYMGWNVLVVAPVLWLINRKVIVEQDNAMSLPSGLPWAIGVYALAVALWICGKRYCARRLRSAGAATRLAHASA